MTVIGQRLRQAREERGLTLNQLSELSGLSKPHLSRLESGERQPSIAAILDLVGVLGVSVSTLFGEDAVSAPLSLYPPDTARHDAGGLEIASCSGYLNSQVLEALRITVTPGRPAAPPTRHGGEEWLYVLSGTLELEYDGQSHRIAPGTSAHFDANRPHRMTAAGEAAEVLLVSGEKNTNLTTVHR
jgi:transcriptional regulator with XRE-family HTH domain